MLHQMKLKSEPFESIKCGLKKVEMRLNDQKRSLINKGDFICFTNLENNQKIYTLVTDKLTFDSFDELYKNFDKTLLGYTEDQVANPADMACYYSQEQINAFGTVALVIELITRNIEIWDLYDDDGKVTGETHLRGFPIPDGRYHLAVHAWITDGKGNYLISQRSSDRKKHPLLWECVGGSVLVGETSYEGALREIREEIGLDLSNEKYQVVFEKKRGVINGKRFCDFVHVYLFYYHKPVDLEKAVSNEVTKTMWATAKQIKELWDNNCFVPTLGYFFEVIVNK